MLGSVPSARANTPQALVLAKTAESATRKLSGKIFMKEGGMATDSRDNQRDAGDKPGQHDANTCPIHGVKFVVARDEAGEATLGVISAPLEQTYRVANDYGTRLFLALCRSRGLLPYRHRRSHAGTISVRACSARRVRCTLGSLS
jgi:hypothetical protein